MKFETPLLFVGAARFKKLQAEYGALLKAVEEFNSEQLYLAEHYDSWTFHYSPMERLKRLTKSMTEARAEKKRLAQFEEDARSLGYEKIKKQPDNYQYFDYNEAKKS